MKNQKNKYHYCCRKKSEATAGGPTKPIKSQPRGVVGSASKGREEKGGEKVREGEKGGGREEGGGMVVVVVRSVECAHISVQARTEMQRIRCPSPCGPKPKKNVTYSLTARAATPSNCQAQHADHEVPDTVGLAKHMHVHVASYSAFLSTSCSQSSPAPALPP